MFCCITLRNVAHVQTYVLRWLEGDRASLFLVNRRQRELFARMFDVGAAVGVEKLASEPVNIRLDFIPSWNDPLLMNLAASSPGFEFLASPPYTV